MSTFPQSIPHTSAPLLVLMVVASVHVLPLPWQMPNNQEVFISGLIKLMVIVQLIVINQPDYTHLCEDDVSENRFYIIHSKWS